MLETARARAQLLITPEVGAIVGLTFVAAIHDPRTVPVIEAGRRALRTDAKEYQ